MSIGVTHVVVVSALIFGTGVYGVLARRSLFGMLLALQLMLAGACVALVGFARFGDAAVEPLDGMAVAFLALLAAAAEVTVVVAVVLLAYRRHRTVQVDELDELAG
ncbi:MAG TPA: NADH-quinone oxidoreductase subunit NuoK [Candidatus Dormibacteraeota bacterium]|jgi:NADH-quinone oxidoreductase subunit K|nr:NADH-quinone oxidoreductase subunit NuoK [Candidatus Dormibacteraeota bacterium]